MVGPRFGKDRPCGLTASVYGVGFGGAEALGGLLQPANQVLRLLLASGIWVVFGDTLTHTDATGQRATNHSARTKGVHDVRLELVQRHMIAKTSDLVGVLRNLAQGFRRAFNTRARKHTTRNRLLKESDSRSQLAGRNALGQLAENGIEPEPLGNRLSTAHNPGVFDGVLNAMACVPSLAIGRRDGKHGRDASADGRAFGNRARSQSGQCRASTHGSQFQVAFCATLGNLKVGLSLRQLLPTALGLLNARLLEVAKRLVAQRLALGLIHQAFASILRRGNRRLRRECMGSVRVDVERKRGRFLGLGLAKRPVQQSSNRIADLCRHAFRITGKDRPHLGFIRPPRSTERRGFRIGLKRHALQQRPRRGRASRRLDVAEIRLRNVLIPPIALGRIGWCCIFVPPVGHGLPQVILMT